MRTRSARPSSRPRASSPRSSSSRGPRRRQRLSPVKITVVIESRDGKADLRDVEAAERLRRQGAISAVRASHASSEEHGLWLPDQILGAYGDALCGAHGARSWEDDWASALASIEVIEVSL